MACNEWNEQWVARLYDELDPDEDRALSTHLADCDACRATLDELERSRLLLGRTSPYVPAGPRVIVLGRPRGRRAAWNFAYGVAAAWVVFVAGAWVGTQWLGSAPADAGVDAVLATSAAERAALENRIGELEARLTEVASSERVGDATAAPVTREEHRAALAKLEREIERQRARDMEFVMGEMSAVEFRAAKWVDETREGVRLVAMQNDPNLSQR
ncbi:MAG TPA: zf-HC2 domain-containing protein [Candidatus Polarisedimenticolaceae bacterium]|nr:zf-HC2 domain-containing protein [Candidatus Polarisedimenticolaceae bacterium]